jgi:hypothetical protein
MHPKPDWDAGCAEGHRPFSEAVLPEDGNGPLEGREKLKSLAIQSKITLPANVSKSDVETYPSSRNYLARNSIRPTRTR